MFKQILLSSTALLLVSGCATKEPTPSQALPQPQMVYVAPVPLASATFAGETLTATPQVSRLVQKIKALSTQTAYLELRGDQNVEVGNFLNIKALSNKNGYLKVMIIDPNGERNLLLPNSVHNGYLEANQRFYSNNADFSLKATKPTGLHYVVVIFSEQNARMVMQQGTNGYNAINDDQALLNLLTNIKNQNYGKSHISIFPLRIY